MKLQFTFFNNYLTIFAGHGKNNGLWYTAISIYIVGSKLQGYGTRPKGGMGRLELILGFRGCRLEALIRQRKLK